MEIKYSYENNGETFNTTLVTGKINKAFNFDSISFDGNVWTFGTMRTENFFQFIDFNKFGNWQFYKQ